MEFDLNSFVNTLREVMYDNFPFGPLYNKNGKSLRHPNRQGHMRDYAFMRLPMAHELDTITFDIGSENAELNYPHYHILEDSQVIHIKGRGTKKSKGSQDKISDKKARDYGIVKWNGKTFSQEYKKNVRGARSRVASARQVYVDNNGVVHKINENSGTYTNIHYHYIEKCIDMAIPVLCQTFELKSLRKQDTGLAEEMALQTKTEGEYINDFPTDIITALESFMEE